MEQKLSTKNDNSMQTLSSEEIHKLLTYYIREIVARRRYGRVYPCPRRNINGFLERYFGRFEVADYTFEIYGNKLSVQKGCKTIGECDTNEDIIVWLFQFLDFIIEQRHIKEFRSHITYKL